MKNIVIFIYTEHRAGGSVWHFWHSAPAGTSTFDKKQVFDDILMYFSRIMIIEYVFPSDDIILP